MILAKSKDSFLQQLFLEIDRHAEDAELDVPKEFAEQFFQTFPLSDLQGRKLSNVYDSLQASWKFFQNFDHNHPKVCIFNPDYKVHGLPSNKTVIAILASNMPFVADSVRTELNRRNILIHSILRATFKVKRSSHHDLVELLSTNAKSEHEGYTKETMYYLEISRAKDKGEVDSLLSTLKGILDEVSLIVEDFHSMQEKLKQLIVEITQKSSCLDNSVLNETLALLTWLMKDNFVFLGFEQYLVSGGDEGFEVSRVKGSELGMQREQDLSCEQELHHELASCDKGDLMQCQITFSKHAVRSRVHRGAYPDCITVKAYDQNGVVNEEYRFTGLFTSTVYTTKVVDIPVIRKKYAEIASRLMVYKGSHEEKELLRVVETFPRDELFLASMPELFETVSVVYDIQERRQIRLFVRRDINNQFFSCLLYAPKEIYSTAFRAKVQNILVKSLQSSESEFTTFFSESVLTRTYFVMKCNPEIDIEFDATALQNEVIKVSKSWSDLLLEALREEFDEEKALLEAQRYADAFPPGYQHDFDSRAAVNDIKCINTLMDVSNLTMFLYRAVEDKSDQLRFRIYRLSEPLVLSDMLPILENLGMKVVAERPYSIERKDGISIWMYEYSLIYGLSNNVDVHSVKGIFNDAFDAVWNQNCENDNFNRMILGAQLTWREIALLRSFAHYMKQINFGFDAHYIAETLANHLLITQSIVKLFHISFDPQKFTNEQRRRIATEKLEVEILKALDQVENLNEDRIFRQYLNLIKAMLRTNFYQKGDQGDDKSYFSFKFKPDLIDGMPLPCPMYEIFVYSPWVEGVHLRAGKIARGGLRWSDRQEDFRTEVLGLVKAQQVKNAVIVPVGAKGGFVVKKAHKLVNREQIMEEGIACYKTFIRGILDITDNLKGDKVIRPKDVVTKDGDDYYMVVAADKGTATFSDIANEISQEYNFWLGDAFASGGSIGYDHKKMGITARGAWVSVERHFREVGHDTNTTDFTVLGVGDMAGDVFGNGMLLSKHICLVFAFNHMHLFIDPNPDSAISYVERERLFNQPRSSWADYNKDLLSAGGGIFLRSAKSIAVTPQMQARFNITQERMTSNELISACLQAPVDLIWNGGIGTYAKASSQSHTGVGDKANDPLRVDGSQLSCKVIGEGGNLGFTQLARVEYALRDGCINTDFIDNAAGVDCSDHEVNIKILLNDLVSAGEMTLEQRRSLLESMTDDVASDVLRNNYRQVQMISLAESQCFRRSEEFRLLITSLEASGRLDREIEFIPDEETLNDRHIKGQALTRPELSILASYVKGQLKDVLAQSDVPDEPYLAQAVESAFPQRLVQDYKSQVYKHRLHREIIATQIANDLVNDMGITFVERLRQSTGEGEASIARAYVTSRDVFGLPEKWLEIEALDYQISAQVQMELMSEIRRLVRRASRWFLRNRRSAIVPALEIEQFKKGIELYSENMSSLLSSHLSSRWQQTYTQLLEQQVPESLACYVASASNLYAGLGIVEVAQECDVDVVQVAEIYYALGEALDLPWFAQQITDLTVDTHWQALARESFREDVEWQQRSISKSVIQYVSSAGSVADGLAAWLQAHELLVERWHRMLTGIKGAKINDFAMYSVAIRELLDLAQASKAMQN